MDNKRILNLNESITKVVYGQINEKAIKFKVNFDNMNRKEKQHATAVLGHQAKQNQDHYVSKDHNSHSALVAALGRGYFSTAADHNIGGRRSFR